ncbi:MAG TPA: type IV toxin-antitoxin system AbiEi family antitoxin [Thermodesulfobacteriota bacterium]
MQTSRDTRPSSLSDFVDALQATGRYTFTHAEAVAALGRSDKAVRSALGRLAAKQRIVSPRRGFHVIVPLEYRSAGGPPPSWFIDALMDFIGRPYYVGLLTAAMIHGAAHQSPQEFQVITSGPLRTARAGRARIRFLTKRRVERTPTMRVSTPAGSMRVSTREATALDLVRYAPSIGSLDTVATVLVELANRLDGSLLVEAAQADQELATVQRLGYLLERVGGGSVTGPLAEWLAAQRPRPTRLRPDRPLGAARKDERWALYVNETVEPDL